MIALLHTLGMLQAFTFALGLISLALSVRFYVFFSGSRHHLSRTMRFFLTEQLVTTCGTLYFSWNSLCGTIRGLPADQWNTLDPTLAITIRVVMFAAMIQSTASLSWSVLRVLRDSEPGE